MRSQDDGDPAPRRAGLPVGSHVIPPWGLVRRPPARQKGARRSARQCTSGTQSQRRSGRVEARTQNHGIHMNMNASGDQPTAIGSHSFIALVARPDSDHDARAPDRPTAGWFWFLSGVTNICRDAFASPGTRLGRRGRHVANAACCRPVTSQQLRSPQSSVVRLHTHEQRQRGFSSTNGRPPVRGGLRPVPRPRLSLLSPSAPGRRRGRGHHRGRLHRRPRRVRSRPP